MSPVSLVHEYVPFLRKTLLSDRNRGRLNLQLFIWPHLPLVVPTAKTQNELFSISIFFRPQYGQLRDHDELR